MSRTLLGILEIVEGLLSRKIGQVPESIAVSNF